jgi:MAGUK p55 subfamily protein 5
LQEAIRRRKAEEDRVAQQNEFLNRSVRGSRKLQALESHSTPQSPTGVVNDAYSSADDVDLAPPSAAEEDKSECLHRVIGEYCSAANL